MMARTLPEGLRPYLRDAGLDKPNMRPHRRVTRGQAGRPPKDPPVHTGKGPFD